MWTPRAFFLVSSELLKENRMDSLGSLSVYDPIVEWLASGTHTPQHPSLNLSKEADF
jgi:hypothetical protein